MLGGREECRGHGGEIFLGQTVEVPVGVFFRILGELHDERGVRHVGGNLHEVLVELYRIDVRHAALLQDLGVQGGELVAHGGVGVLGLLLDEDDLLALLGQLAAGGDAGEAVAADDGVAGQLLGEVGDLGRRRHPAGVGDVVDVHVGRAGALGGRLGRITRAAVRARAARGAVAGRRAAGEPCGSGGHGGHSTHADERAAGDALVCCLAHNP
mgnify:CR=1 FL=1